MKQPLLIHQPSLTRQFDRRSDRILQADFLLREVERRMLARLDFIKVAPTTILDLSCGRGQGARALQERFQDAHVLALDVSWSMLARSLETSSTISGSGRGLTGVLNRLRAGVERALEPPKKLPSLLAANAHALPFADASVDLIWTNLAMHWWLDPVKVIAECRRVLRPHGLLIMSSFGPDTLVELRQLNARYSKEEFAPTFQDLHDVGDALNQHKFADPVMDMERLTIEYRNTDQLLADLRAFGGNSLKLRHAGLKGRQWLQAMQNKLAAEFSLLQQQNKVFTLTFEIVYGHAWAPMNKQLPEGYSPIEFRPRSSAKP